MPHNDPYIIIWSIWGIYAMVAFPMSLVAAGILKLTADEITPFVGLAMFWPLVLVACAFAFVVWLPFGGLYYIGVLIGQAWSKINFSPLIRKVQSWFSKRSPSS